MFGRCRLPILATVPRSGTWFIRYVVSFVCHLERGGRIDDRLTGHTVGDPAGPAFDFAGFRGGPLFDVQGSLSDPRLFIGHAVCPGFHGKELPWWSGSRFHVPGYDYFSEGHDYRYTPIELDPDRHVGLPVRSLQRSVRHGRNGGIVFVYRNPIDQAASYYRYCRAHRDPAYSTVDGRPLASLPFAEYLFRLALPSYARQFASFQVQARRHPGQVLFVAYETIMRSTRDTLATILDHLNGQPRPWPLLDEAIALARGPHLKAIEAELGRSLDGTRADRSSHITRPAAARPDDTADDGLRSEALSLLTRWNIDMSLLEFPVAPRPAAVA